MFDLFRFYVEVFDNINIRDGWMGSRVSFVGGNQEYSSFEVVCAAISIPKLMSETSRL